MARIFRQPGETGIKIKNVNQNLVFDKYNINVFKNDGESYELKF